MIQSVRKHIHRKLLAPLAPLCQIGLLLLTPAFLVHSAIAAPVDFTRDIKPILSNKCIACHGPDEEERAADLRLDTFEGATRDLDGYKAIVPGDPEDSEMIYRMTQKDEDEVMPPPKHGQPLSPEEVAIFKQWIKEGANYAPHWSYQTPVRPDIPQIPDGLKASERNPIDAFVIDKLVSLGLKPEPEADKHALIRRAALDLTGLQPTMEDIAAYQADRQPGSYERMLDRYLNKATFGERWASFWLDLARYADSTGYASDEDRTIWAYRDWVIKAFNDNKPFDQFTIEQLAGDLLPEPTQSQLIATAFHRNTMTNTEGGTIDEEFRTAAVVDRVNTTFEVWMGTTMACAQCHTHKYDPITHKDYFKAYAVFNSTEDSDRKNEAPYIEIMSDEQRQRKTDVQQQLETARTEFNKTTPAFTKAYNDWINDLAQKDYQGVNGRYIRLTRFGNGQLINIAEVEVLSGGKNIALKKKASQSSDYQADYAAHLAVDGIKEGSFTKAKGAHTKSQNNPWWEVDLGASHPIDQIIIWNRTDRGTTQRLKNLTIQVLDDNRKKSLEKRLGRPKRQNKIDSGHPLKPYAAIARIAQANRSEKQKQQLLDAFRKNSDYTKASRKTIAQLEKQLASIKPQTTVPIMRELPAEKHRETYVQIRGNWLSKGEKVERGYPESLYKANSEKPTRLDLAKWLVDGGNPLTARVITNRIWEQLFGHGIVLSSEEFGSQGELPTHPELLDYLATTLVDGGWNVKAFLKHVMTSATYRQSSFESKEKLEHDPFNYMYSRGPRVRVTAEMVRDQALLAAGLLSTRMYGKPVHPPAVKLGLKAAFSKSLDWEDSKGEDRYRRALYTRWRRSSPYASMATFDMTSREVCTGKRSRSNTPLQALVTLNDPVYVEAAQGLARQTLIHRQNADDKSRLTYAFQRVVTRQPSEREVAILLNLKKQVATEYQSDEANARAFATEPLGKVPDELRPMAISELAAWTVVANVILNQDEFFQKR